MVSGGPDQGKRRRFKGNLCGLDCTSRGPLRNSEDFLIPFHRPDERLGVASEKTLFCARFRLNEIGSILYCETDCACPIRVLATDGSVIGQEIFTVNNRELGLS
jgi:hypothetical protein